MTNNLNHKNFFDIENPKRPNNEGRVSSYNDDNDLSSHNENDNESIATSRDENNTHPEGTVS